MHHPSFHTGKIAELSPPLLPFERIALRAYVRPEHIRGLNRSFLTLTSKKID